MKKFWAEVTAKNEDVQGQNDDNNTTEDASSFNIQLSLSAEESGVAGVALLSLKEMFWQAAILLGKKDSIMEIPFKPLTFMVESDRGRPHYVVRSESGKVTCDDCPCYKSGKIFIYLYPHFLAVAEKRNQLKISLLGTRGAATLSPPRATSPVTARQQLGKSHKKRQRHVGKVVEGKLPKSCLVQVLINRIHNPQQRHRRPLQYCLHPSS